MKILIPIKRVIDPYVKIRINRDHSGIETQNVKMVINPFDEIALEEAIRLKEQGLAHNVTVISIGDITTKESLRTALALGADAAIWIETEQNLEPLNIAKILKYFVEQTQPELVIMGKQSIDGDNNQTGQMLAGLLNWPQATFASKIAIANDQATVTREVDDGLQILRVDLPAVITADLHLNEPRYANLPNIMKAKNKPLTHYLLADLGLSLKSHQQIINIAPPKTRKTGVIVNNVQELLESLRNDAKVI